MKGQSVGSKIVSSLVWKLMERGGVQIIQFVVSIVIARLLEPAAYGTVALITIFVSLATVFVQSGLGSALVQKKDVDSLDFTSVFYFSFIVATIAYLLLFLLASPISYFYNLPDLKIILRVMALTLFPGAVNSIQIAVLSKSMKFKLQFYASFVSVLFSGLLGIILASSNFGAWALVGQQLSYQVLICIVLWCFVKWRPTLNFSFSKTKSLLQYGSKILFSNLIDTIYHNLESLIIGKKYSEMDLAFFSKGKQFPLILIDNINGSVQSVMFVAYSDAQDDIMRVKSLLRKTISLSTYIVFPATLGLAAISDSLIPIVLGNQWVECVPFVHVYCLLSMLIPLQTINLQAINALGRTDVYFIVIMFKRFIGVALILCVMLLFDSPISIAYAALANELISVLINIFPNRNIIGYSPSELLADILPNLILSAIMALAVIVFGNLFSILLLRLMCQCVLGVAVYILLFVVTNISVFCYIKSLFFSKILKNSSGKD